jgi:hypothetical protein
MDEDSRNNARKTRGRPFTKGNSGRPRGARNRVTRAVDALLDGEAEKLTRKCVDLALEGDTTALRLCMERVAPLRKGRPVTLKLPKIATAEDLVSALASVVEAVSGGTITPEEGATVAGILEVKRKAIETLELDKRIARLEQMGGES